MCFIVARLRAFPSRIGTSGTTRPCAHRQNRQQSYEYTQEPARAIATKQKYFSASNYPPDKRGGKKQDCPTITTNQGAFLHLLPHSARRRVIQFVRTPLRFALTPARVYAHSVVFRLLPSPFTSYPYSIQNVTIRGGGFTFVRSSPSSPEKSNSTHRLFSCKASSVRRLHMGELMHFSSFTGTFTRISLILCNL